MDLTTIGLSIINDFISIEEEIELLKNIDNPAPKKTKNRNNIQRFGSDKPYKSNIVAKNIPVYFDFILDKLEKLLPVRPDSVSINQYTTGQLIAPHIDSDSSGDIITVLSLLSDATMIFNKPKGDKYKVLLPARSLVQMKDEIRKTWMHSIEPVKSLRYSIVFRCSK